MHLIVLNHQFYYAVALGAAEAEEVQVGERHSRQEHQRSCLVGANGLCPPLIIRSERPFHHIESISIAVAVGVGLNADECTQVV